MNLFERMYKTLLRIRKVEEKIIELYPSDKIQSPVHLSIGQEALAVGLSFALKKNDKIFQTYRSHATYIARNGCLKKMFAELYGKVDGISYGKAGSMHLISPQHGIIASSAIVASTISHAIGSAYASKLSSEKRLNLAIFGDGATEEGVYHECLNLASVMRLPILFVCENNGIAIQSKIADRQAYNILDHAKAYGIESEHIQDGWNFKKIYQVIKNKRTKILKSFKPALILINTKRTMEHVGIRKEDIEINHQGVNNSDWVDKDFLKNNLELNRRFSKKIEQEIEEAISFAENSNFPDKKYISMHLTVPKFNEKKNIDYCYLDKKNIISYKESIMLTLKNLMKKNNKLVIFGQGADDKNGTFGTTLDFHKLFGKKRCFDTPIAEESLTGFALGLSISGYYPINTHIRNDFLLLSFNQLINLISKFEYMFGGWFKTPMLIRAVIGRSWGQGAQHSQSIQSMLAHNPGLTIIMPSSAESVIDSYTYAVQHFKGPVVSLEHRLLYDLNFDLKNYKSKKIMPFKSKLIKEGKDLTIVATSIMVWEAKRVINLVEQYYSITIELIDLHCISFPDKKLILKSISKTKKIIVLDTSWKEFGVAAEISRIICESMPNIIEKPMVSICNFPSPCPTSKELENHFYPNTKHIYMETLKILGLNDKLGSNSIKKIYTREYYKSFKGPF